LFVEGPLNFVKTKGLQVTNVVEFQRLSSIVDAIHIPFQRKITNQHPAVALSVFMAKKNNRAELIL